MNEFPDMKKTCILLNSLNMEMFQLVTDLMSPANPIDKNYKDSIEAVNNHLQPKPNIIAERYKFNSAKQSYGEKVVDYVPQLKRITANCDYKDKLDDLRDALVIGSNNEHTKKELFKVGSELTFTKALQIASDEELANRNAKTANGTSSIINVSNGENSRSRYYSNSKNNYSKKSYPYCDSDNHRTEKCFKRKSCAVCGTNPVDEALAFRCLIR